MQLKVQFCDLRYWMYGAFVVFIFIVWAIKLFTLQILQGQVLASEALDITRREENLKAKRGLIYYRDGITPIVDNIDVFTVSIRPSEVPEAAFSTQLQLLSQLLGEKVQDLEHLIESNKNSFSVQLKHDVDIDIIQEIAEHHDRLIGVTYSSVPERNLLQDGSIVHVVGYVGKISDYELEILYNDQYQGDASIGKAGIEQYYDSALRGYDGSRVRTVDAKDNILEEVIHPPETGLSLTLTIDQKIQKLAEHAIGNRIGSVVVMRPATGEILAMVSRPWYHLKDFSSKSEFERLVNDSSNPLINRTIQAKYPPASTFKLITATAILAQNRFPVNEVIHDPGFWKLGKRHFRCWYRSGHGDVNFIDAIAESCNIYFGVIGVRHLGIDNISRYAQMYGLGQLTGVDLPGEVKGLVATPDWKKTIYNHSWTYGDTLNMTIGQGYLLVTPLQVATFTSAIVNNGFVYKPFLLKKVDTNASSELENSADMRSGEVLFDMGVEEKVFRTIQSGMRQAVVRGTAKGSIYNGVVDIAAKTGTAEVGLSDYWQSWFASYGPYKAADVMERVVVVVHIEASLNQDRKTYEWWAPRAADIIYRGIFANESYEEVWLNYKKRLVWFHPWMKVPETYQEKAINTIKK